MSQRKDILIRCRRFLEKEGIATWLGDNPAVGIALSGGADSVALLLIGQELGWKLTALHCNFQLRGEESLRDENFVKELCRILDIPLHVIRFDVAAKQHQSGESLEMACRSLRYKWFREMAETYSLKAIALGHHADDNIETLMLNALRGSGLGGIKGILPRRDIFIRPLLEIPREAILDYLQWRNVGFVTDSTNLQSEFRRNRLRNEVLPTLYDNFPGGAHGLTSTLSFLRDDYQLFKYLIQEKKEKYCLPDGKIKLQHLLREESSPAPLLFHLLEGCLDRSTIDCLIASADESGRYFHGKGNDSFLLDRGILSSIIPSGIETETHTVISRIIGRGDFAPRRDGNFAWFDASILDNNPEFELRDACKGDRMQPFGMKGTRLLSDIFSDLKIPDNEKWIRKVLIRNGEIIWIPGLRQGACFPVTAQTTNILELHWEISE